MGFDIADGAADFGYYHIGARVFADVVDKLFDFVGDMRNYLDGRAEILAAALFVEDVPINLTGGEVGVFVKVLVDKAFVVPEVEVGFGAVLRYVHFAVLIGAHGTGVNVYVGVELLRGDLKTARL